jgi:hypothetical protein
MIVHGVDADAEAGTIRAAVIAGDGGGDTDLRSLQWPLAAVVSEVDAVDPVSEAGRLEAAEAWVVVEDADGT